MNENTAVIEMADASGLWRLKKSEKNPLLTHTFGTGELIMEALKNHKNINQLILCVGGSATNDAGLGMLYFRFYLLCFFVLSCELPQF